MRTESLPSITIACWLAWALVVVVTAPVASLWAQASLSVSDPAVAVPERPTEVTFLIETITVEGNRHFTSEIILSESLLREGREYSERQLREAVNRIVRLPLVLDAEFFLRKGSDRGLHTLVIEVEEASRWFFGFDTEYKRGDRSVFSESVGDSRRPLAAC